MRVPVLLAALCLLALPLTGCLGGDKAPDTHTVKATAGRVSPGFAYDGAGLEGGDATLDGQATNSENKGAFFANFTYKGSKYAVVFDQFQGASDKPFQDGGVAFNLDEHGASGHGDAMLPKLHAQVAAWGTASVTRDGSPVTGKAGPGWSAHLMVFDDAVRGPDGKITKADGSAPFDPSKPEDAKTYPGQKQAILKLVSPDGETAKRSPVKVAQDVSMQGPQAAGSVAIPIEKGALPFKITVNGTPASPAPAGVGQITVSIKADTKEFATDQGQVLPNQPYSHVFEVKAENLGNATKIVVDLSGAGAYTAQVSALVEYADEPLLVVTWDNPTLS